MYFLKRSVSFVRLRVLGKFAFSRDDFELAFARYAFRDFADSTPETEESIGWVAPDNCLHPPNVMEVMVDPYFQLMMRIDRKRVSGTLLAAQAAIEERAALEGTNRKRLSRKEKSNIRKSVREHLLQTAPTSIAVYRALWNFSKGRCFLFTTSKAARGHFCKLFSETFGLELEPLTPSTLAGDWAKQHGVKYLPNSVEPSSFAPQGE